MKGWDEVMRKKSQCVCVCQKRWVLRLNVNGAEGLKYLSAGGTTWRTPVVLLLKMVRKLRSHCFLPLEVWGPLFLSFSIPFKSESAEKTHTDLLTLHVRCSECEQAFCDVKRPPLFTSYCPFACLYVLHGAQLIFTLPPQPKTHVMFFRGYPMIPDTNSDCEVPASPNTKKPILEN